MYIVFLFAKVRGLLFTSFLIYKYYTYYNGE